MSSLIGRVLLGRYRVLRLLARGGMGEVYLARSEGTAGFHRPVVVKRVLSQHADDASIVALFEREARIMSTLRHPSIVSVLDFGRDGPDQVMVIEYVHGFHLGRWSRFLEDRGVPFPVERAIQIVLEVLGALDHAHNARGADGSPLSVVHRDVSPANVLIDVEGTVKLADFGIARMEGEHTVVESTQPTSVKGKFPYLPPEIFDGKTATASTDVYASAVVLDEILRGRNAFRSGNMAETLARVLEYVPESLDGLRDDVSPALAKLISRAIAKDPAKRFQTAAELITELRKVRRAEPDAARAELTSSARRDFLGPDMAHALEVPALGELEALWEAPVPVVPPTERLDASIPTLLPPRRTGRPTAVEPPQPRRVWPWVAAALAASALIGLGLYFALRPSSGTEAPVFVLIEHEGAEGGGAAAEVPVDAPIDAPIDAGHVAEASIDAGRSAGRVRAPSIEAPFRARSAEIGRCFSAHVASLDGTPEIDVRFVVRGDGTVERASVLPGEVGSSALGACIQAVATSTRFVGTGSPVTFVVPLGARRAGH